MPNSPPGADSEFAPGGLSVRAGRTLSSHGANCEFGRRELIVRAGPNFLELAVVAQGKNIVTSRHLFGNTLALISGTLLRLDVKPRLRDLTNLEAVE